MSVCFVIGIIGHAINRWCDYVLAVYPNGKITIDTMNDVNNKSKMSHLMKGTDPSTPFKSAMYGVVAIFMEYMGYTAIAFYIYQYQHVCGIILFVAVSFFAILAYPVCRYFDHFRGDHTDTVVDGDLYGAADLYCYGAV